MAGSTKCDALELNELKPIVFSLLLVLLHITTSGGVEIIEMTNGEEIQTSGPNYFCYLNMVTPGWRESWAGIQIRVWSSKELKVTVVNDEEMQEQEHYSIWTLVMYFMQEQTNETFVNINLFAPKTCFRVDPESAEMYTVKGLRKFDVYLFVIFLTGVLLFFFADILSRSQIFYYTAGMSTGMFASLIIIIFIMARFLPKKSPFYILIVGGWSLSMYIIQLVGRNLQLILKEHWHLAIGYATFVGFISFAVCYRHGPLVEERSINILSWTLQLFGLMLIYVGIRVQHVALAIMMAALSAKYLDYPINLALMICHKLSQTMHFKLEPRRMLTLEEYEKQTEVETTRALEQLRQHCNSPEFNPWKTISRLRSPRRFADFVEGSPHLLPNEVSVHAQEYKLSFLEETTDEEDEVEGQPLRDI